MKPLIRLPKLRVAADALPAWAFLLLLIIVDWGLTCNLRSPEDLAIWLGLSPNGETALAPPPAILVLLGSFLESLYFPIMIVALMVVLLIRGSKRGLLVSLMIYLEWATTVVIWSLVIVGVNLFNPATAAEVLLMDTLILWVSNIVVFAAWYWLLDYPGQAQYSRHAPNRLHLLFPQRGNDLPTWENWKPNWVDYLYLSFLIMAQFGPSDTIPLTRVAKAIVAIQSAIALLNIILIAARAINLVK